MDGKSKVTMAMPAAAVTEILEDPQRFKDHMKAQGFDVEAVTVVAGSHQFRKDDGQERVIIEADYAAAERRLLDRLSDGLPVNITGTVTGRSSMKQQIITIGLDGTMQGLDHKRKGLDLRQFGKAKIQRVTLVEWSEDRQAWLIYWDSSVVFPGEVWTAKLFIKAEVRWESFGGYAVGEPHWIICFNDYEDAVAAEVAVIQAMQLAGDAEGLFP